MFDHVSIGVRDLARSRAFYDAILFSLGHQRLADSAETVSYGSTAVGLWLIATSHPVPADTNSGLHLCFAAPGRDAVRAFHAAAVKFGGRDNGEPEVRSDYGPSYYAAFVLDPDGYRLEAFFGG